MKNAQGKTQYAIFIADAIALLDTLGNLEFYKSHDKDWVVNDLIYDLDDPATLINVNRARNAIATLSKALDDIEAQVSNYA